MIRFASLKCKCFVYTTPLYTFDSLRLDYSLFFRLNLRFHISMPFIHFGPYSMKSLLFSQFLICVRPFFKTKLKFHFLHKALINIPFSFCHIKQRHSLNKYLSIPSFMPASMPGIGYTNLNTDDVWMISFMTFSQLL